MYLALFQLLLKYGEFPDEGFVLITVDYQLQRGDFDRIEAGDALVTDVGSGAERGSGAIGFDTLQMPSQNPLTLRDFLLKNDSVDNR